MIPFVDDFLSGQQDCKEGIPHKAGKSEAYDRGYAAEYAQGQIQTEINEMSERLAQMGVKV